MLFLSFRQSIHHKVQDLGLQTQYNDANDRYVKLQSHIMLSLAIVSPDHVTRAFIALEAAPPAKLDELLDYFDTTTLLVNQLKKRGKQYLRLKNDVAVTGSHKIYNISEGFYNKFRIIVRKYHPICLSQLQRSKKNKLTPKSLSLNLYTHKLFSDKSTNKLSTCNNIYGLNNELQWTYLKYNNVWLYSL